MALENDFHKNQMKLWDTVKEQINVGPEVRKVCEEKSQVIGEDERVVERWKEYFEGYRKEAGSSRTVIDS